MISQFLTA